MQVCLEEKHFRASQRKRKVFSSYRAIITKRVSTVWNSVRNFFRRKMSRATFWRKEKDFFTRKIEAS